MKTPAEIAEQVLTELDLGGDLLEGTPKTAADLADAVRSGWIDGDTLVDLIVTAVQLERAQHRLSMLDTASSASSQYYIETGQYMTYAETFAEEARPALAALDEAVDAYQEAAGEDGANETVRDYEHYEDAKLAFADTAEYVLRRFVELQDGAPE